MKSSRRDKLIRDPSHDPTRPSEHLADPVVCPDCGATYIEGRWTWRHGPVEAPRRRCAACVRIRDDYPAGFLTLRGDFARVNREALLRLARNTETREKRTHPINRIMRVEESDEAMLILTTEPHLAQSIGHALHSAYKGDLRFDFQEDIVRVTWQRDD